ncbi:OmpA family protein [Halomonas campaniensis]|uniref:OmpA family protein n=1 Tax=Halomonas campaniensis TaxID=213554 RepID=UPI003970E7FE
MVEEHRGPSRYDHLLDPVFDDEGGGGWMISYMDIMTLLVALLVLILVAAGVVGLPWRADAEPVALRLGIPLPEELRALTATAVSAPPVAPSGRIAPAAVTAALGVAGLPRRALAPELPEAPADWLIRRAPARASDAEAAPPPILALPSETDRSRPLRRYLLVLADTLPVNAEPLEADRAEAVPVAPDPDPEPPLLDLPDLEGVAVSRVPQGIRLRVEERLLFPSADAELTAAGSDVVAGLVETIQRHDGVVSVEGHSDDRPISTPAYASNWALSSARAIAILHALEGGGVDSGRLQAVGFADTQPIADNATNEGRARNRRVEIVIHVAEE